MEGPISRSETLVHQIYHYLKSEILCRGLLPGEKIIESKLAVQLGVSRSPVREAIRLLIAEELLFEDEGTIRAFIPSYKHLHDLYQLRLAVESFAACFAAKSISDGQLAALKANIDETQLCVEHGEFEKILDLNATFHESICKASGNTRFLKTLKDASTLIYYYYYMVLGFHQKKPRIMQGHMDIYNALYNHDSQLAFMQMHRHISHDFEQVKATFENGLITKMNSCEDV